MATRSKTAAERWRDCTDEERSHVDTFVRGHARAAQYVVATQPADFPDAARIVEIYMLAADVLREAAPAPKAKRKGVKR